MNVPVQVRRYRVVKVGREGKFVVERGMGDYWERTGDEMTSMEDAIALARTWQEQALDAIADYRHEVVYDAYDLATRGAL